MTDLEEMVKSGMENLIKSGSIEKIIETQIFKTVESAINDQLRGYSDFGKMIEEKLKESFNCTDIEFPRYNQQMIDITIEAVDKYIKAEMKESINKKVKDFFQPLDFKSIKLSEIIDKFKENINQYNDKFGETISIVIENDSTYFTHIYFDENDGKDKYQCDYQLSISNVNKNKNRIFDIKDNRKSLSDKRTSILGEWEGFLYQLFAQKIEIIVDEENVNDYIDYED